MKKYLLVFLLPLHILAQSVTITPGASLVLDGAALLTIQDGGLINNGHFLPGTGTVVFSGTAPTGSSLIGGTGSTIFSNLTINKSFNDVLLNSNIAVNGTLTMQAGNLQLNNYTIDLGSGAGVLSGENNSARITGLTGGAITKTLTLNAPAAVNPGNMGLEITSTANMGSTLVRRGHVQQTSSGGGLSIDRYFDILPANNSSLNAALKFYYFDNELAGRNKSQLTQWSSADGGVTWAYLGQTQVDNTNDWVQEDAIAQLHRVTLASNIVNPLPIELLYFTGIVKDGEGLLNWATEMEYNNDHFDVQRSATGTDFTTFGSVPSQGNSNSRQLYQYTDPLPFTGYMYYRLKQVDLDGNFHYSPIVILQNNTSTGFAAYPNPATDKFTLVITATRNMNARFELVDQSGRLISVKEMTLLTGVNSYVWDISRMAGGTYFLHTRSLAMPVLKIVKAGN